jgi:rod shape-determining protein MreD
MQKIAVAGVTPDIALVLLIFFANREGSMHGQTGGFISGLVQDFLSTAPLGFYAFIRTLTGFLFGITKGKLFVDPLMFPIVLVVLATLLKALASMFLSLLFLPDATAAAIFSSKLWIEIGLNAVLAPFLFGILKLFKIFKVRESGGFV